MPKLRIEDGALGDKVSEDIALEMLAALCDAHSPYCPGSAVSVTEAVAETLGLSENSEAPVSPRAEDRAEAVIAGGTAVNSENEENTVKQGRTTVWHTALTAMPGFLAGAAAFSLAFIIGNVAPRRDGRSPLSGFSHCIPSFDRLCSDNGRGL